MRTLLAFVFAGALCGATLDGIEIHSTTTGTGPKTVILVHGWTCDETSWASQVPALGKEYRVITLDLPGHGKTAVPRDGQFSMALFARAVEAVRAEQGAERVVLVGHSMGVPVIREYARRYPQHAAGLVLVDGPLARPQFGNGNPGMQMGGKDGPQRRETMIRGMFSSATTPEMQKHILDMMLGAPEATAVGAMNAAFDAKGWSDDSFAGPVLVVVAATGNADQSYMKDHFPRSEFQRMTGTGHFLMMEKPAEFNQLLLTFLKKPQF